MFEDLLEAKLQPDNGLGCIFARSMRKAIKAYGGSRAVLQEHHVLSRPEIYDALINGHARDDPELAVEIGNEYLEEQERRRNSVIHWPISATWCVRYMRAVADSAGGPITLKIFDPIIDRYLREAESDKRTGGQIDADRTRAREASQLRPRRGRDSSLAPRAHLRFAREAAIPVTVDSLTIGDLVASGRGAEWETAVRELEDAGVHPSTNNYNAILAHFVDQRLSPEVVAGARAVLDKMPASGYTATPNALTYSNLLATAKRWNDNAALRDVIMRRSSAYDVIYSALRIVGDGSAAEGAARLRERTTDFPCLYVGKSGDAPVASHLTPDE
ncbi:hypothetical protein BDK51DRAFT_47807 [Blyttiomyces helicus]|uniref:Pentacotripeptide-repeat region of PRORP domain-containing protein n=1 Tax=Blyttiomyces helicus TaxID=388810 RepID=A0A4V1IR61_9FUNG|nr:hypothetical protein BDK51DRAFT_47807 [Blyttiomyces helicus]|eukprot:RKO88937.1 hypothetical protein BDK51DRAFT_47807 [Blyttiomyces helicus]